MESYIESKCVDIARRAGYESRKVKFIAHNGAPDRIFFKPGRLIWVEMKQPGGVVSAIQEHQQSALREAGQEVFTVFTVEEFEKIINEGDSNA